MEKRGADDQGWIDDVLAFWFGELTPEDWFASRPELDRSIRERFAGLNRRLAEAPPAAAYEQPRAALAAIITLDQFSRNMFRGKPEAFGSDSRALEIARNAVDRGFDRGMSNDEKSFVYMPFMHSEAIADQERCVSLFSAIYGGEQLKYAIEHRDIVARFARFPHRNRALGRQSTEAELAFLAGHKGFGQ